MKIEDCTLTELFEWCDKQTYDECIDCVFSRKEDNFCPVNSFRNFLNMQNLENEDINISK